MRRMSTGQGGLSMTEEDLPAKPAIKVPQSATNRLHIIIKPDQIVKQVSIITPEEKSKKNSAFLGKLSEAVR